MTLASNVFSRLYRFPCIKFTIMKFSFRSHLQHLISAVEDEQRGYTADSAEGG
jgi:hypothetical protein